MIKGNNRKKATTLGFCFVAFSKTLQKREKFRLWCFDGGLGADVNVGVMGSSWLGKERKVPQTWTEQCHLLRVTEHHQSLGFPVHPCPHYLWLSVPSAKER
jgi:hypothetical protein